MGDRMVETCMSKKFHSYLDIEYGVQDHRLWPLTRVEHGSTVRGRVWLPQLQLSVQPAANGLQQFIATNLGANFQTSILTNIGGIPLSLSPEMQARTSEIIQHFSQK
jgi:hypothetical protein